MVHALITRVGLNPSSIERLHTISLRLHSLDTRRCNGWGWGWHGGEIVSGQWRARWGDHDDANYSRRVKKLVDEANAIVYVDLGAVRKAGEHWEAYHQSDPCACSLWLVPHPRPKPFSYIDGVAVF